MKCIGKLGIVSLLVGFSFIFCFLMCGPYISAETSRPLFNVGYQVIDLKYIKDNQEQNINVAVWYPTAAQSKIYNYGGPTNGNIALDAVPYTEAGPYPLLVFSHGFGGSGLSAVFLTEALAACGWIVACPDHNDKYSAVRIHTGQNQDFDGLEFMRQAKEIASSSPADRGKYFYRIDEMKIVLDGMQSSDIFGQLIDSEQIAVGGHSFGGFTALGLCGTIKESRDSRIKALLLFSTGAGGYLYTQEELSAVQIPCMLFMGQREEEQDRGAYKMSELSAKIYENLSGPKYFLEIKGAGHFSFNNCFSKRLRARLLSGTKAQFAVIRQYSIAFLEKYINEKKDADLFLKQRDPLITLYYSNFSMMDK